MRRTTQRWQGIWQCDGPALIGQTKKKILYIVECWNDNAENIKEFPSLEPTSSEPFIVILSH
jgi:hypothetical protein